MIHNFSNLITLSNNFTNEDVCRKYLEEIVWNGKPICPHCGSEKVSAFKDGKRYKCANNQCYSIFNVKVGTFLEGSKIPLCKWFHAMYVFTSHKKGISSHQLAKDIGITQKSAWFVLSRIREILREKAPFALDGIVEVDETYVGGKDTNKHRSKIKVDAQGYPLEVKVPVIGVVQRDGKAFLVATDNVRKQTVFPIIHGSVKEGSTMVTDAFKLYRGLRNNYTHQKVDHSKGEYVKGAFHTNTVEGFFSHLKRGLIGIYYHASPKHLHRYCNEFSFRYNTRKCGEVERFDIALRQCVGRLKYADLIQTPELSPARM
jgi:transposase-like protein